MYAIIKADGRQYKVSKGDVVCFDRMGKEPKSEVLFEEVLCVSNNGELTLGTPVVKGAKVTGEVVNEGRGQKVVVFKKRRRKDSKQKRGFRRDFTRVRIAAISI